MSENSSGARLDRIEDKIDKLSDAMVSLARTEEKILGLEQDRLLQNNRLNMHSERIDKVENAIVENSSTVKAINRVFWIAITAFTVTIFGRVVFGLDIFPPVL